MTPPTPLNDRMSVCVIASKGSNLGCNFGDERFPPHLIRSVDVIEATVHPEL